MWGTPTLAKRAAETTGITPTCVGNTAWQKLRHRAGEDHPHLCGEHPKLEFGVSTMSGSPPPVWGTLLALSHLVLGHRITPTCVGNTEKNFINFSDIEDHPHLCGEHGRVIRVGRVLRGSPPPVWGTLSDAWNGMKSIGITPTCVGNTQVRTVS